jgi:putative membrane protein
VSLPPHQLITVGVIVGVIVAGSMVVHTPRAVGAPGEGSISALEESYLHKASEGQRAEVDLGQLAVQKASSDPVKQYGARMIQDHQRAREELQKLSKEVPREAGELSMPHQQIQRMLVQLSGKDFDKAYMSFMVRDHMKEVGEWEQRALTVTDARVERWMASMLRLLKDHLEQGRAIAAAIGVNAEDIAKVEDATSPSHPY